MNFTRLLVAGLFKRYDGSLLIVPPLVIGEQIHDALHVMAFRRLAAGTVFRGKLLGMAVPGVVSTLMAFQRDLCPLRCTVASCHQPPDGERPLHTREARGGLLLSGASSWLVLLDSRW